MMNSDTDMISKKRPKIDHPSTTTTSVVITDTVPTTTTKTNQNNNIPTTNHHRLQSRLKLIEVFGHLLSNEFLNDDNDMSTTTTSRISTTNSNTANTNTATTTTTTTSKSKSSTVHQFYNEPYPYGIITSLLLPKFLLQVLDEIKQSSKVQYKESDLYKVYQSIDLANLNDVNSSSSHKNCDDNNDDPSTTTTTTTMPSVLQLRDLLYSIEFRYYMEDLNQLPRNTLIHNNNNNNNNNTINPNQEDTSEENGHHKNTLPSQQQIDCACNCHMPTCHLLCHDDVIGTRKISYILYLTEPTPIWTHPEGGALELYDSYVTTTSTTNTNSVTTLRIPHTVPCQSILPIFNSLVYFVVRPGYSYHSVQEVFGQRPRLSIQGWYHTAATDTNTTTTTATATATATSNHISTTATTLTTTSKQYSTLQRLKTYNHKNHLDAKEEDTEGPFISIVTTTTTDTTITTKATTNSESSSSLPLLLLLSESDRHTLQPFICDTYLTEDAIRSIRKRFANDSSIQLRHFLKDTYIQPMNVLLQNEGNPMIQLQNDDNVDNKMDDASRISSFYHWGVTEEWKLIGPPHKQRFLEYQPPLKNEINDDDDDDDDEDTKPPAAQPTLSTVESTKDLHTMGSYLQYIRNHLFQSKAFYNYLSVITHLDSYPIGYRGRIRRFRPGRDYTVAHYGLLTERSVLDATLCFVKEIDDHPTTTTTTTNIDNDDSEPTNDAARAITQDGMTVDGDTEEANVPAFSEAMELWQSGECGGFECYIEADDDDDAGGAASGPADEYNPEDDTELLNVSASNNTLSLVYRDPGTMRFIKYVSATAPSSRYDIAMEYDFPEIANDEDDDVEEEEEEDIDNDDSYEPR